MRTNYLMAVGLMSVAACTSLGPTPATTGISAVPMGRPSVELTGGVAPGYYLSEGADSTETGTQGTGGPQTQSLTFEPDRLLKLPGLIVGARRFGEGGDAVYEPMLGYRRRLDQTFALIGVAYGTRASGENNGASYDATRLGGEVGGDAGTTLVENWLSLHGFASLSATYIDAKGEYCVSDEDIAVDCGDTSRRVEGELGGVFAAGNVGAALHFMQRPTGIFHGARLAFTASYGSRPRLERTVETRDDFYSFGLALSVALGAGR